MHDLNRTQMENGWETGLADEFAYEDFESEYEDSAYEYEGEDFEDFEDEDSAYEMDPETYDEAFEMYEDSYGEMEGPLDEAEEMELAAQLLEITDEQELDYFLGSVFKKVAKTVGKHIPSSVRKRLGGYAKSLAKKLLPVAGAAVGNFFVPGVGGVIGGKLSKYGGRAFGLELEGLSPEDQEFEIARRYVRLISDAAQEATVAPPAPPRVVSQKAIVKSAQKHAPGLMAGTAGQAPLQKLAQRRSINKRGNRVRVIPIQPGEKFVKLILVRR